VQSLALSVFFVLLMSPPSPLSTLFPYTTLFRSVARRRPGAFGGIRARVAPTGHARRSDPGDISIATRPPSPATPRIFAPVDRAWRAGDRVARWPGQVRRGAPQESSPTFLAPPRR